MKQLTRLLHKIQITDDQAEPLALEIAFLQLQKLLIICRNLATKVIVIGNGGSAAIAAHTVNDLVRNCEIPALCFSEVAVMTCLSNDLGYNSVYEKQVQLLMQEDDILIAISSSGKSENIIRAVSEAREKGCFTLTLSGFQEKNFLRQLGEINVYVPSDHYGYVELIHQIFLHCLTDSCRKEE